MEVRSAIASRGPVSELEEVEGRSLGPASVFETDGGNLGERLDLEGPGSGQLTVCDGEEGREYVFA